MDVLSVESTPIGLSTRQSSGGAQNSGAASSAPVASSSTNPAPSTAGQENKTSSHGAIATAVKQVNDALAEIGQNLYASYQKDKITGIEVVQFHDMDTQQVVRQIPSKEILAVAQSLSLPPGIQGQLLYDKA